MILENMIFGLFLGLIFGSKVLRFFFAISENRFLKFRILEAQIWETISRLGRLKSLSSFPFSFFLNVPFFLDDFFAGELIFDRESSLTFPLFIHFKLFGK